MSSLGSWSFIIGLVIALLVGLFTEATGIVAAILAIIGLVIGFLNITDKEINLFLLAAIALMLTGLTDEFLVEIPAIGNLLQRIVNNFMILVAPAAIVVSVKALLNMAKD